MIRSNSLLGRLFILLCACAFSSDLMGQRITRQRYQESGISSFLDSQWWLGLKLGANLTQPDPSDTYSALSAINYDNEDLEKEYEVFSLPGMHAGLDITYYHRGFYVGLQPVFKRIRYAYQNQLTWDSNTQQEAFLTDYDVEQSIEYVEIPLVVKYDIVKSGNLRPFVSGGIAYSMVTGARKKLNIMHSDMVLNTTLDGGEVRLSVADEFQAYAGVMGGIGASIDYGNIRAILDVVYHFGLTSAVDQDQIFNENELFSLGDVNDNVFLRTINISLGLVFPLRFLDTTFQSG